MGTVAMTVDGPIGWIEFDHRARRNAMTVDMWAAVPEICGAITSDERVRVVILRGAGDEAFVAGADITEFGKTRQAENSADYDTKVTAATDAIDALEIPVIALIHGYCIGGGLSIALSADVRYAADDAQFGLPPARLGIGYGAHGLGKLVDIVGPSVAKEIIYTANWYNASTALRWGLANHVEPKAELDRFVTEQAHIMAQRAPLSQRAAKLAVADHLRPLEHRRSAETAAAIDQCFTSLDYAEGVTAFMEKRQPSFRGH